MLYYINYIKYYYYYYFNHILLLSPRFTRLNVYLRANNSADYRHAKY